MPAINTRILIGAAIGGVLLLVAVFFLGRATADADESAAPSTSTTSDSSVLEGEGTATSETLASDTTVTLASGDPSAALLHDEERPDELPEYGSEQDRSDLVDALAEAGIGMGSRETILWVADSVCYDLERLEAQDRSAAFAVRVVWNETLADLDSVDAAAFGAVFNAAPFFLCPESIDYAGEVAYWLGF